MEDVSHFIDICPTNSIQVLNLHEFLRFSLCPSNDIFDINKEKTMLELGPHGKDRKYSRDKAYIGNPKVNIGCSPLTANRTSADCVDITPMLPVVVRSS